MKIENENQVIETCLLGHRSHFEPLVKKYQSHVIALAVNILGNYDDALDITQETFVQVYTNLHRFDLTRKFKTWVLSIAAKRCLDHLRKKKTILNYFLAQTKEFKLNFFDKNQYRLIEESEIFFPLLKKMKDNERIALLLQMNETYSAREIADVLECSENTARVHLFNAKQKLKKALVSTGKNKNPRLNPVREVFK
ncbi:MAG: RNA polymerase sigma factor [bacterium]|nr:RNA polymerase sigma factor [bacterium]